MFSLGSGTTADGHGSVQPSGSPDLFGAGRARSFYAHVNDSALKAQGVAFPSSSVEQGTSDAIGVLRSDVEEASSYLS
jgi:hypothetical protein